MPPKKQITRETILAKALEITCREGFDAITARSLAAALECSTQPIYQAFADMKALERETARSAFERMTAFMREECEPDVPAELAAVLRYIRFALEEKRLFALIARNGLFAARAEGAAMPPMNPKLVVFANGIVFMALFGSLPGDWGQIRALTVSAYEDFTRGETANHAGSSDV